MRPEDTLSEMAKCDAVKESATALRTRPIRTSHLRSEHSQGGAQRSEQYLYGAQRVIKLQTRQRGVVSETGGRTGDAKPKWSGGGFGHSRLPVSRGTDSCAEWRNQKVFRFAGEVAKAKGKQ
jgi:hypothetical protein